MVKRQGWHGESRRHAAAAKGESVESSDKGQGWHGDSKGHSKAAKGQKKSEGTIADKMGSL